MMGGKQIMAQRKAEGAKWESFYLHITSLSKHTHTSDQKKKHTHTLKKT